MRQGANHIRYAVTSMLVATAAATTVLMPGAPVAAAPATPPFGPAIDAYARYDGQDTCDPVAKPGVVDFRNLINRTYGTHTAYVARPCNVGGRSEHKEGRALDYMLDVGDAADRAVANDVLTWLLATDRHGNRHAIARRIGIMYVIWNRQIWKSYAASRGWQPYTGSNPHTDHIHYSFSWAGALRQTTWWTAQPSASKANGIRYVGQPR
jgi:hypothetical protein